MIRTNLFKDACAKWCILHVLVIAISLFGTSSPGDVIQVPGDYATIQGAIDAAKAGDEIIVDPGIYYENIDFKGKYLKLRSLESTNPASIESTIIDGGYIDSTVTFKGTEGGGCVLEGFTITGGQGIHGGGINGNGTHATIRRNIIYGNVAIHYDDSGSWDEAHGAGGGINCCDGLVSENIIQGNTSWKSGGGLFGCMGVIEGNTISGNSCGGGGSGLSHCHGAIRNNHIMGNTTPPNPEFGIGVLHDCDGYIENNIIARNSSYQRGLLNECDAFFVNNTFYNNEACLAAGWWDPVGPGALFVNCIFWHDIENPDYFIGFTEQYMYCCIKNWSSGGEGNISEDPEFIDPENNDFRLQDASPCIDQGHPDAIFNDGCLPPGKGTEWNDMGAFGGMYNCAEPSEYLKTLIAVITEYGDVWAAENKGVPPFGIPKRWAWLEFLYKPLEGWYPLKGNTNAGGRQDLIEITPYGDAWVSLATETNYTPPTRWGWLGFRYEENTYNGWIPLNGDTNGDGADDLIQVTEYGDAWVAISTETSYSEPNRWGWLGYRFNRGAIGENGAIPLSGDANGDGKIDLIQITEYTDAWVALSAETMFDPPARWGWLGFHYSPYDGWYPLCGDVNGDALDDLVQITPTGDPWVALAGESLYNPPARWGWLSFYYDEAQGYYPLLGDVNADGKEDLIQITPGGEQWVSLSTGEAFETPEKWGWLGFIFSREKGYMPFYLEY